MPRAAALAAAVAAAAPPWQRHQRMVVPQQGWDQRCGRLAQTRLHAPAQERRQQARRACLRGNSYAVLAQATSQTKIRVMTD